MKTFHLKKLAALAALASIPAFAEWDYYPVLEEHHGNVRTTARYWYYGDYHSLDLSLSGRFTIIKGLEINFQQLGYQFFGDPNDDTEEGSGFKDFSAGLKYSFNPYFGVFGDVDIPVGADDVTSNTVNIKGGIEWFIPVTEQFGIGNELALSKGLEHDDITPGLNTSYGFEVYYAFKSGFTPFAGWVFSSQLTDTEYPADGEHSKSWETGTGTSNVSFWVGTSYSVTPNLTLTLFQDIEYAGAAYFAGYILHVTYGF